MASWCDVKLFLCILVVTCYCTVTLAQMPTDCCLSIKNKEVAAAHIGDYRYQPSGHGCSVEAMILVTRRGRTLCVPNQEPWVLKVKAHVNNLKKFCKTSSKSRRCEGVNTE
ncbi:C-C motif chemokine 19-like [Mugil cephalus]|uniref:C-C motif chemokine 19-like n=1 Tax=Mugil cephalus TaxID=48193 RepID=UPI001FB7A83C|nr:C-C motif chemokine 19-like [Mugil cephalus]